MIKLNEYLQPAHYDLTGEVDGFEWLGRFSVFNLFLREIRNWGGEEKIRGRMATSSRNDSRFPRKVSDRADSEGGVLARKAVSGFGVWLGFRQRWGARLYLPFWSMKSCARGY